MLILLSIDFLASCLVHPALALLNSTPQLLARDHRVITHSAQLDGGDLAADAGIQAAVYYDRDEPSCLKPSFRLAFTHLGAKSWQHD